MESILHRIITTICLLIAAGSIYGMYTISNEEIESPVLQSRYIATAEDVVNEVKRKPLGSFTWFSVSKGAPLAFRDAVFVGDKGQTNVVLNDGSKLTIGENSLIVLDTDKRDVQSQTSNVTEFRLVRGNIAVEKAEGAKDLQISVGTDSKVRVTAGSSLALGKRADVVDIVVKRGKVKLGKANNSRELAIEGSKPSLIKNINLNSNLDEMDKRVNERETLTEESTQNDSELLKQVGKSDTVSEVESKGTLNTFAKDIRKKDAPPVAVAPPPPDPLPPPPPPKPISIPTKVIDIAKKEEKMSIELPEGISEGKDLYVEMSFNKDISERLLRLPMNIEPGLKTYDIDMTYLVEVPGFKKRALKYSNLYWRIVSSNGKEFPVKWVALRTPKTTLLRVDSKLTFNQTENELKIPLRWLFKGVFVDRFQVTLSDKSNKVICRVSVPNSNFVDPTQTETNDLNLQPFSYDLVSNEQCNFSEYFKKKKSLRVRVEPVDADGKIVASSISSRYDSLISF